MSSNSKSKSLESLFTDLVTQLSTRIKSGEADASTLNVARALLKDNGIQARPSAGSPLGELAGSLPSFTDDEDELPKHH